MSKDGTTTNDPDTNGAMSLERKLELLEKRFITPASGGTATSTPPGRAEAAAFMADCTSNLSSHSFSFTTPQSLSRPASDSSNLPPHAVRSKRRPSLSSSLHAVQRATERHLRKVAANSPVGGLSANNSSNTNDSNAMPSMLFLQDANRSLSPLPPSTSNSCAASSQSNQTLLINNKHQQQHTRVVAESPPVIVSPHGVGGVGGGGPPASSDKSAPPKPAAARNLLMTSAATSSISTLATASNPAPNQVCLFYIVIFLFLGTSILSYILSYTTLFFSCHFFSCHIFRNARPCPNANNLPSRTRVSPLLPMIPKFPNDNVT
jgi:hypothetical protein